MLELSGTHAEFCGESIQFLVVCRHQDTLRGSILEVSFSGACRSQEHQKCPWPAGASHAARQEAYQQLIKRLRRQKHKGVVIRPLDNIPHCSSHNFEISFPDSAEHQIFFADPERFAKHKTWIVCELIK